MEKYVLDLLSEITNLKDTISSLKQKNIMLEMLNRETKNGN